MDSVRFGRALGMGAREVARALVKAAEAAAAPSPRQAAGPAPERGSARGEVAAEKTRATVAGVKRGGRGFGEAVWNPVARLSGVLWLEVTGVFFGLFALTAALEAWKRRADFQGTAEARQHLWFALAMLVVFGYFTVSSFARARNRGRMPTVDRSQRR